jgi:predicted phage-related endonuclease
MAQDALCTPAPALCEIDSGAPPRSSVTWPQIASLGLSREAVIARFDSIGGSDANTILSGSGERILRLWREKRGEVDAEDLSDKLPVMLGSWTEAFNRQWYEKLCGEEVTRVGERVRCPVRAWRSATLDGYVDARGAIWEAKHTSPFVKPDELLQRYMPQLQHTMAVTGCELAMLSVIYGNGKWEVYEVASDWMYQEDLLEAELRFWHCVQSGEPPAISVISHAPKPVGVREVCMTGHNQWAAFAADWLEHRAAARTHAAATSSLKELIEDDVARAHGHGIEARRSKAGAVTIREIGGGECGERRGPEPGARETTLREPRA